MRKPTSVVSAEEGSVCFSDEKWLKKLPTISEHLSCCAWEDGSVRVPSTLSIAFEEGYVRVALNDKDLERSCYTSDPTVEGALALMESALARDAISWRSWKSGNRRRKG